MLKEKIMASKFLRRHARAVFAFCKGLVMGLITGSIVGVIGVAFAKSLEWANSFRSANKWVLFLLPLAGLAIVFLYRVTKNTNDTGTNMVIESIHSSTPISYKMAPLIFISTVLTHLCGGSAGREGAALQLGGSITNFLSDRPIFRFSESDHKINIMCGMSAGFAALFGTPMAAAIFSLEVVSVGIMHYAALVPSVISAYTAYFISTACGIRPEAFAVPMIPQFTPGSMTAFLLFGAVLGIVSIVFCVCMHDFHHLYARLLKNPYLRAFVGGCLVITLTLILGTERYLGSGIGIIEEIFEEGTSAEGYVFLLKLLFTALTLGAGFKGGEIVPAFCVGASFGSLAATILGVPVPLAAACGMVGVFCGVTNSPITSLLIAFEMFGFEGMPYYLMTIAASYLLSGYFGLYSTQRIVYSKIKARPHRR